MFLTFFISHFIAHCSGVAKYDYIYIYLKNATLEHFDTF